MENLDSSKNMVEQVPGLGMDESGKVSEKLKYSRFPVVKRSTCEKDAQISPTFTQYCAGFTNGTIFAHFYSRILL